VQGRCHGYYATKQLLSVNLCFVYVDKDQVMETAGSID